MISTLIRRQRFEAATVWQLRAVVQEFIDTNGYGASDVGGRWRVRGDARVTHLSYNGRLWHGDVNVTDELQ